MKSLCFCLIILLISMDIYAQIPNQFAFQGVARNTTGQVVASQNVFIRFTLRQGSESGTSVYQETHSPQTTAAGMFNVSVGAGTATSGSFSAINWSAGPYFLQVELDVAGGTSYATINTTQLQSVPYALMAKNLEGVSNPQDGDIMEFQDGAWIRKPKSKRYYLQGVGLNPYSSITFLGVTTTITIEKDNPIITINISKSFGSTAANGGISLSLNLGYKRGNETIEEFDTSPGGRLSGLRVSSLNRIPMTLAGTFQTNFKAGETVEIGMTGFSPNFSSWNDNGYCKGYVEVSY